MSDMLNMVDIVYTAVLDVLTNICTAPIFSSAVLGSVLILCVWKSLLIRRDKE